MNTAEMFTPVAQNRELALCAVVSLALHALVLLLPAPPPGTPARATAKILMATFAPRPTPSEPVAAASDLTRRRARESVVSKPELTPQPDTSRPAVPSLAVPRAPDVSETPAAPVETAATAPAAATAMMAPGPLRPAETQPAATAAGTARVPSDADPGTLDRYRLALIVAAKRHKRYPAQALDQGWQGRVEVRLVIGADGAIQHSLVKASSGYEILDNEAMDMLKRARPLTPIPAALRGREFTLDIPVIFDLQAG